MRVAQDLQLVRRPRITHADAHQEAVQLALRQRKRALVVDRVLRGQDHEGRAHRMGLAVNRDLAAVHHLEQRRLGLRSGAVDLVGQDDVGEDRPRLEDEFPHVLVVDGHPGDIAGQQVAGELQA